ncbi:MAG: hypothetical protein HUU20_14260 [Pirellulales bacterium]|nr:hypothetical protein [Pirellulales bacterium]
MRSLVALLLVAASAGADTSEAPGKKVIEWGWDEPNTKFIRENIERMEQLPFDGLVFHADSSRGGNLAWEIWGSRRFDAAEFQHAVDDLKATPFRRLGERFLRVNVAPGNVDWFDDPAWTVVRDNFGVAAGLAKESGCAGFMFDVEQYNALLFDYRKQPQGQGRSFSDYQAKVRQRGRQWMEEVGRRFPEITILLTFGYRIAQPPAGKDRSAVEYGLYADFLDGMLEACGPQARLVDAWEFSYPYKTEEQFHKAYDSITTESLQWTAVPEQYRKHVSAGFGIWMDCGWRQVGWNLDDFSKNHFTPADFEKSVRAALKLSDRYVWIYTEQPRWWPREKLPAEYVEALGNARGTVDTP